LKVYRDEDADLDLLKGKRIAILGFGSQGKAQALNLRDSGLEVTIGLRPQSPSRKKAEQLGFEVQSLSDSCSGAELISFLIPDQVQKEVYQEEVRKNLKEGKCLIFAHAFSVHFKLVEPPDHVDVILVAPHGPGEVMRKRFRGCTSQRPMPLSSFLISPGMRPGSFICLKVGMRMLRSRQRFAVFLRCFSYMVRSIIFA